MISFNCVRLGIQLCHLLKMVLKILNNERIKDGVEELENLKHRFFENSFTQQSACLLLSCEKKKQHNDSERSSGLQYVERQKKNDCYYEKNIAILANP